MVTKEEDNEDEGEEDAQGAEEGQDDTEGETKRAEGKGEHNNVKHPNHLTI